MTGAGSAEHGASEERTSSDALKEARKQAQCCLPRPSTPGQFSDSRGAIRRESGSVERLRLIRVDIANEANHRRKAFKAERARLVKPECSPVAPKNPASMALRETLYPQVRLSDFRA